MVVILENVKNLNAGGSGKVSNQKELVNRLNALGYYVVETLLSASSYGIPQLRDRVYFTCFLADRERVKQYRKRYKAPAFSQVVRSVLEQTQIPTLPLEDFLMADPSESLSPWPRTDHVDNAKKSEKDMEYQVEHLQAYQEVGLPWPPTIDPEFFEQVFFTQRRMQECIWYHHKQLADDEDQGEVLFDAHMSREWQTLRRQKRPCIAASSQIWCLRRGAQQNRSRLLEGNPKP